VYVAAASTEKKQNRKCALVSARVRYILKLLTGSISYLVIMIFNATFGSQVAAGESLIRPELDRDFGRRQCKPRDSLSLPLNVYNQYIFIRTSMVAASKKQARPTSFASNFELRLWSLSVRK
jgi:hypothetical protein